MPTKVLRQRVLVLWSLIRRLDAGGSHVVQVLGRLQLQVDVTHPTIDISTRNPMVSLVMKKLNCRCRTRSLPITISLILCFCWDRPLFVDHAPIPFCISTNSLFYGSQLLFCWFNFIFFSDQTPICVGWIPSFRSQIPNFYLFGYVSQCLMVEYGKITNGCITDFHGSTGQKVRLFHGWIGSPSMSEIQMLHAFSGFFIG